MLFTENLLPTETIFCDIILAQLLPCLTCLFDSRISPVSKGVKSTERATNKSLKKVKDQLNNQSEEYDEQFVLNGKSEEG